MDVRENESPATADAEELKRRLRALDLGDLDACEATLAWAGEVHARPESRAWPEHDRLGLDLLRLRTQIHRGRGRVLKALLAIEEHNTRARALELPLELAKGLNTRSTLLVDNLELDLAQADLERALELMDGADPTQAPIWNWVQGNLGVVELLRYDYEPALERFDGMLGALGPDAPPGLVEGIALNRAACFLGLGRHGDGLGALEPLLEARKGDPDPRPDTATVLSMEAEFRAHLQAPEDSREPCLRAVRLADGTSRDLAKVATRRSLVRVLGLQSPPATEEAITWLREALDLARGIDQTELVSELRGELAVLQAEAGDLREAARDLRAGLQDDLTAGFDRLHSLTLEGAASRYREELDHLRSVIDEQRFTLRSLAHDLRGPLTAILLSAEAEELLDSETATFTDLVRGQALRIRELVDGLLALETLGAESGQSGSGELLLSEALEPALATARAQLRGGRLQVHGPTDLTLAGSRLALTRILDNLLGNAIRYSPPPWQVEVRIRPGEGAVTLEVLDRGRGLGGADAESLFRPFSRGDHPKGGRFAGNGLGLAVARRLAGSMGGELTGREREGGGAAFRLRLPLAPA